MIPEFSRAQNIPLHYTFWTNDHDYDNDDEHYYFLLILFYKQKNNILKVPSRQSWQITAGLHKQTERCNNSFFSCIEEQLQCWVIEDFLYLTSLAKLSKRENKIILRSLCVCKALGTITGTSGLTEHACLLSLSSSIKPWPDQRSLSLIRNNAFSFVQQC